MNFDSYVFLFNTYVLKVVVSKLQGQQIFKQILVIWYITIISGHEICFFYCYLSIYKTKKCASIFFKVKFWKP